MAIGVKVLPPAGNSPALLVWQEGADCNSLELPNDLGRGLEGADKGLQRDDGAACSPPPHLSVSEAILVNVPQVIEQNVYSAALR